MLPTYRSAEDVPLLEHSFPMPVKRVHQIELTSHCNLRCVYCPSSDLGRPRVHMSEDVLDHALDHVIHLNGRDGYELNIAGIGETTIHPNLDRMLHLLRDRLKYGVALVMATNGVAVDDYVVDVLDKYKVYCWVSLHRPEKAGPAIERLKKRNLLLGVSSDPSTNADDWAGQVRWFRSQPYVSPCIWLRDGRVMVTADGSFTACCLDASGSGVVGSVNDKLGSLVTKPYDLCHTCAQRVRIRGYEQ